MAVIHCFEPLRWEFQHKHANGENLRKTRNRLQWLGFPAQCNRIRNFRLRTLGAPVSTSDSQEASRNLLRSSKLELQFFFLSL